MPGLIADQYDDLTGAVQQVRIVFEAQCNVEGGPCLEALTACLTDQLSRAPAQPLQPSLSQQRDQRAAQRKHVGKPNEMC